MHDFKLQHRGKKSRVLHTVWSWCAWRVGNRFSVRSRAYCWRTSVSGVLIVPSFIRSTQTEKLLFPARSLVLTLKKKKIFLDVQQDAVSFLLHWPDRHSIWIITALTLSYTVEIVFTYGCAGPWLHMVFWDSQKNLNRVKLRTLKISREKKW